MANDILINKAATIERCINRVREEHAKSGANIVVITHSGKHHQKPSG